MDRRGAEEAGYTLIRFVLTITAVILIILFVMGITSIGKTKEASSKNNLYELAKVINKLKVNEINFYSGILNHPYYVSNQHILVGFNRVSDKVYDTCGEESATKPFLCGGEACLCLYRETGDEWWNVWGDDNDFDSDEAGGDLVDCVKLEDVDHVFTLDYSDDEIKKKHDTKRSIYQNVIGKKSIVPKSKYYQEEYSDLFIYGQCEDYINDVNFDVHGLYLEKLRFEGKNYVLIAVKSESLEERYTTLGKEIMVKGIVQIAQASNEEKKNEPDGEKVQPEQKKEGNLFNE